jgi:uncharacterized membrane protein YbhN (UPF0104 family)
VLGLIRIAVVGALAASLAYVMLEVDWTATGRALAEARWPALLAATACALIAVWTKSRRWRGLLAPRVLLDARSALALVLAGQLANNGLPLRAGEVARVALVDPGAAGRSYVVSTIIGEKLLDACGLVLLTALLGWLAPLPDWLRLATPVSIIAAGLALVAALWAGARVGPWWLSSRATRALAGLATLREPGRLVAAVLWTQASLVAGVAANWWSLAAVGADPTIPAALLVLLALYVGGTLPAPPGRIGVFQALCVAAVLPFGVEPAVALAFAMLHYVVVVVVPSAVGALYLVAWRGWRRPTPAYAPAAPAQREPGSDG